MTSVNPTTANATQHKRRRKRSTITQKQSQDLPTHPQPLPCQHPTLSSYFPIIMTLRSFIQKSTGRATMPPGLSEEKMPVSFLDTTLLGLKDEPERRNPPDIQDAVKLLGTKPSHREVVDTAIRTLFERSTSTTGIKRKPNNILTKGFHANGNQIRDSGGIYDCLISSEWRHLSHKLGHKFILNALINTSIFVQVAARDMKMGGGDITKSNYFQLTGSPITDPLNQIKSKPHDRRKLGQIVFARSRILFAKPSYNKGNKVKFGLHCMHVLNRYSNSSNTNHQKQILGSMFPFQFLPKNAPTPTADRQETAHQSKDKAAREPVITKLSSKVPRRLVPVLKLVTKMQSLHKRCSYHEMVHKYCPVEDPFKRHGTSVDYYASKAHEVSAFARQIISKVIPSQFWGGPDNMKLVMDKVDMFIKLKRYESISLHLVMNGMKLGVSWLCPPWMPPGKMCPTDSEKRREIFAEFLYWLFDSFLVPLLQSHFYITESGGTDQTSLLYFRHDVWERLSVPVLNQIQINMFQKLTEEEAQALLGDRPFGYATMRLKPKPNSMDMRPVMNLSKRTPRVSKPNRQNPTFTRSINSILKPIHTVLSRELERRFRPLAPSTIQSVGDIYDRIREFKRDLKNKGNLGKRNFVVKVDIRSCFDNIKQDRLLDVIQSVLNQDQYRIRTYGIVGPPQNPQKGPTRRFMSFAQRVGGTRSVSDYAHYRHYQTSKVFVDDVVPQRKSTQHLLALLKQHIFCNIVKIGPDYYQQTRGIPQGSVLSSLLCNFLYEDLENTKMPFVFTGDGVLMRLLDDFLYITQNRNKAQKFLELMMEGHPEHGAFVSPGKTLVNFETSVGGVKINRTVDTDEFPYCGVLLNTRNLNISKDTTKLIRTGMNWLPTVEYSKMPQKALRRKLRQALAMQSHRMYFDTRHNSFTTVLRNIYNNFTQAAHKVYYGAKALRSPNSPGSQLLIEIIKDLLKLQYTIINKAKYQYWPRCSMKESQIWMLGAHAFRRVLKRVQTGYDEVLEWLNDELRKSGRSSKRGRKSERSSKRGSDRALKRFLKRCEASESTFVVTS